jgi:hypothetical protein
VSLEEPGQQGGGQHLERTGGPVSGGSLRLAVPQRAIMIAPLLERSQGGSYACQEWAKMNGFRPFGLSRLPLSH